jgi:hypothetical protein
MMKDKGRSPFSRAPMTDHDRRVTRDLGAKQIPKPKAHDPATYWMAHGLRGEGRMTARNGYVCYVLAGCPTNGAGSHPGAGSTERDALLDACYWSNQAAWIRVVPTSRAPNWALDEIVDRRDDERDSIVSASADA